ncbi:hypothetical protein Tco_1350778 [Tanacetum coccineum]
MSLCSCPMGCFRNAMVDFGVCEVGKVMVLECSRHHCINLANWQLKPLNVYIGVTPTVHSGTNDVKSQRVRE